VKLLPWRYEKNNTTEGIEYYKIKCQKHVSRTLPYIFPR